MDRVNAFLDRASDRIYKPLPAIERLKWHLVRRRLCPSCWRSCASRSRTSGARRRVRVRGTWYGDYPFRTDSRLKIPRSVYRLTGTHELWVRRGARRPARRWTASSSCAGTRTSPASASASEDGQQREPVASCARGGCGASGCGVTAVKLPHEDDAPARRQRPTPARRCATCRGAGFEATLDPRDLRRLGRQGRRQVGAVRHRAARAGSGAAARASPSTPRGRSAARRWAACARRCHEDGEVTVDVRKKHKAPAPVSPPVITGARWTEEGALELSGELPAGSERRASSCSPRRRTATGTRSRSTPPAARFTATLTPARIESLGGPLPLPRGASGCCTRTTRPSAVARGAARRAPARDRRRPQAVRVRRRAGRSGRARRPPGPRRGRARGLQPAPPARDHLHGRPRRAAAGRGRLQQLPRPPVLRQPAGDPRGARAPRRAARAPVGRARRALSRARDRPRPARGEPRVPRGDGARPLRGRQRPLPGLVRPPRRTSCACRPGTARR